MKRVLTQLFSHEVFLAIRSMRRSRWTTVILILVVGFGVGAVTATFSFLDAALFRPLPFPNGSRAFALNQLDDPSGRVPIRLLHTLQEALPQIEAVEGYSRSGFLARLAGENRWLPGASVSPGLFELLGVEPQLGSFSTGPDPDHSWLVISYRLWQEEYQGDPNILDRTMIVNGSRKSIRAVMPLGIGFPHREAIWEVNPALAKPPAGNDKQRVHGLVLLAEGASFSDASEVVTEFSPPEDDGVATHPLHLSRTILNRDHFGVVPWLLFAAAILILMLVCANAAAINTVWWTQRRGEWAILEALGAQRSSLRRQLFVEGGLLGVMGWAMGLAFAVLASRFLGDRLGGNLPAWFGLELDGRGLLFSLVATAVVIALVGIAPALTASRVSLWSVMQGTSRTLTADRGAGRFRARAIIAQMALSTILVAGTFLMGLGVRELRRVDPGYNLDDVSRIALWFADEEGEPIDPFERTDFVSRQAEVASQVSGISGVSYQGNVFGIRGGPVLGTANPLDVRPHFRGRWLFGRGYRTSVQVVHPNYFDFFAIRILAGRSFGAHEGPESQLVTVVHQALADDLWPGENPLGQELSIGKGGPTAVVIGVAADVQEVLDGRNGIEVVAVDDIYLSVDQALLRNPSILVRTEHPDEIIPRLESQLEAASPEQVGYSASSLKYRFHLTASMSEGFSLTLSFLGIVGLFLSAIGLFGLVVHNVLARTKEVGVRRCLGAGAVVIVMRFAAEGAKLTAQGALVGLGLVFLASPIIGRFLYEPPGGKILPALLALVLVFSFGSIASVLPAMRAARIHPSEALRAD